MGKKSGEGQRGGVSISGTIGSVGGSIVGGDMTVVSAAELDAALRPLHASIEAAPAENRAEAGAKLAALKEEVAKGKNADDSIVAKLVDGFVSLVPAAASAIVSVFATPILGAVAGPVTKFVLDRIQSK